MKLQHIKMNIIKNTKVLTSVLMIVFSILVVSSFASAVLTLSLTSQPSSVSHDAGSVQISFNLTNTNPSTSASVSWTKSPSTPSGSSISISDVVLAPNESRTMIATVSFPAYKTGSVAGSLTAVSSSSSSSASYSVPISSSSSLSLSKVTDITASQNGIVSVTNTGNSDISNVNLSSSGVLQVSFSNNNFALVSGSSSTVTVTPTNANSLKFGSNSVTIKASIGPTGNQSNSLTLNLDKTFCNSGSIGNNLTIEKVSISNTGEDDDIWRPLDEVTIEVRVRNNADVDLRDIVVELGLFDETGRNLMSDMDFMSSDDEQADLGRINDNDKESIVFEFKVPADFDTGNYKLAVKAYSDDLGESKLCADSTSDLSNTIYQTISVDTESDSGKFIAFDGLQLTPSEAICGDTVALDFRAYNVGDSDEDQIKINLNSRDFGVSMSKEIKNFDQGDSAPISFTFTLPSNLQNKVYDLELTAQYDYRSGSYRESLDQSTLVPIKVFGCTSASTQNALISAPLSSDASAGKSITITSTIRNVAPTSQTFVIDVKNYDSWANLVSVSERLFLLNPGESKDISIALDVKDSVSGSQRFTIEARSGSVLDSKDVQVNVSSSSGLGFALPGDSWIWIIGAVNVILVILIIIVAVKVARR